MNPNNPNLNFNKVISKSRKKNSKEYKDTIFAISLVTPAVIMLCITILFPLIKVIIMSFFEYNLLNIDNISWNNFKNYKSLFATNEFILTFIRTLYYVFMTVAIEFIIGLTIALLLNKNIRGKNIFRGLLFLPWTIPALVVSVVWMWIFQPEYGILNYILNILNITNKNINWLGEINTAMPSVIVAAVWREMPFMMIMILAALQTVSTDLIEAANIDGANTIQSFFNVTLPSIMSVVKTITLTSIIANFQMLVYFFTMTGGGPIDSTTTLSVYTYNTAFSQFNMGKGAASGVIWMIFLIVFSLFYNKLLNKKEIY